jgi:pantoate--beta-alanine ligase
MKKYADIDELRAHLTDRRRSGERIGFVPTMGGLHEGHLSLIRAARADCDEVVVSIFVNPTQFGEGEDYADYPRHEASDLAACRAEDVDVVFCPTVEQMYPSGDATRVVVGGVTEALCGPHRPGHFDGVTTVVAKLFNIVQPDRAYFGQKDAQQAVVIRRMTHDLRWPIDIVVCPTVREPEGLAMSSRNAYLSPDQRRQASSLYRSLMWARCEIEAGRREAEALKSGIRSRVEAAGPCVIDYVQLVDADTLEPRAVVEGRCLIALAVRIGSARLIDNILIEHVDTGPAQG